ncbi:basic-leucine zipper transcription factor [Phycomyces blakesleeanus]|uniref:Basic-leucine zipper transcription factor n=2 Tax=Phycomyces blakesleeanus TaxID=4837 RepID=A0A167KDS6_PHYB8|nr:basic-leucine zipper transcription factor [Phycomyces blakesleeanus NRRL 1555(-)]OAD67857.1 basic-leucine zipper transcription factor [Phycomyces blakesleeanus NRRL 1555(-)]|eukprot:XP_018285897.1 basic-leucine zipper transcription factor [Phycomyces blakesleeanus NRRL 1555(-)]
MDESPTDYNQESQFNFHHFNQEYDFGIVNTNGERIRKRKSPGRKPNPPSISERKAQNRASQKAFREREQQRRQEQENMKNMYLEEIARLNKRVELLEYESNYLRGWVLQYTLSSIMERGTVADIWTSSREFLETETRPDKGDESKKLPFAINSLLKDNRVIGLKNAIITRSPGYWKGNEPSEAGNMMFRPETRLDPDMANINRLGAKLASPDNSSQDLTEPGKTCTLKPAIGTITSPPTRKTAADLAHMPPIQALQIIRLQMKCGNLWGDKLKHALIPTELQRTIPHDARIDFLTGSSTRDRLIIFQDYYDTDECFEFYSKWSMFNGGNKYDTRNWAVTGGFPERYWFLSHEVIEDYFLERHWKVTQDLMLIPSSHEQVPQNREKNEEECELLANPKPY